MSNEISGKGLRGRLTDGAEERLGRALSDLLENPLLTGAVTRAFDARERAAQAQEVAMGALNLPSAADIERLTRRLRSVSQRLEGIEDGVHRLERSLANASVDARMEAIEGQLQNVAKLLGDLREALPAPTMSVSRDQERLPVEESPVQAEAPKAKKRAATKRPSTRARASTKKS